MGLLKPFWMKEPYLNQANIDKMRKKIDQIDDQKVLAEIVDKAPWYHAYEYALRSLTDQTLLEQLTISCGNKKMREYIVAKLVNQQLLYDLGMNDPDGWVRLAAAENITTPAIAQEIYMNMARSSNFSDSMRTNAYNKIEDESLRRLLEDDPSFSAAKQARDDDLKRSTEIFAKQVAERKKINKRYSEGRCPHCGARLTGWDNYTPPTGLKQKPTVSYICGACGKGI